MPTSEPTLQIRLFGCPNVLHARAEHPHGLGRPLRLLMACLLIDGPRAHHRESLAGKIWPAANQDSASRSFRTALWRLRQILEPEGTTKGEFLNVQPNGEVRFNWDSDFKADVVEFETGIRCFDNDDPAHIVRSDIDRLKRALELYDGELLEGSWDDWVIRERERLRHLYLRGLNVVLRCQSEAGDYEDALRFGRRILELDPLRESTHRDMLRLHVLNGQRADAIRQYESLVRELKTELDVEPSETTKRVFAGVMQAFDEPPSVGDAPTSSDLIEALSDFAECLEDLDSSRRKLRGLFERISKLSS